MLQTIIDALTFSDTIPVYFYLFSGIVYFVLGLIFCLECFRITQPKLNIDDYVFVGVVLLFLVVMLIFLVISTGWHPVYMFHYCGLGFVGGLISDPTRRDSRQKPTIYRIATYMYVSLASIHIITLEYLV